MPVNKLEKLKKTPSQLKLSENNESEIARRESVYSQQSHSSHNENSKKRILLLKSDFQAVGSTQLQHQLAEVETFGRNKYMQLH